LAIAIHSSNSFVRNALTFERVLQLPAPSYLYLWAVGNQNQSVENAIPNQSVTAVAPGSWVYVRRGQPNEESDYTVTGDVKNSQATEGTRGSDTVAEGMMEVHTARYMLRAHLLLLLLWKLRWCLNKSPRNTQEPSFETVKKNWQDRGLLYFCLKSPRNILSRKSFLARGSLLIVIVLEIIHVSRIINISDKRDPQYRSSSYFNRIPILAFSLNYLSLGSDRGGFVAYYTANSSGHMFLLFCTTPLLPFQAVAHRAEAFSQAAGSARGQPMKEKIKRATSGNCQTNVNNGCSKHSKLVQVAFERGSMARDN